ARARARGGRRGAFARRDQYDARPAGCDALLMRILVLGGTKFLGRAIVDAAHARGHALTLFNRGQTDAAAYPDIEQVHGDRQQAAGLARLVEGGRTWDAAIDTAAYLPRDVSSAIEALSARTEHWTFVSSISAHASHALPGQNESSPVATLSDAQRVEVDA